MQQVIYLMYSRCIVWKRLHIGNKQSRILFSENQIKVSQDNFPGEKFEIPWKNIHLCYQCRACLVMLSRPCQWKEWKRICTRVEGIHLQFQPPYHQYFTTCSMPCKRGGGGGTHLQADALNYTTAIRPRPKKLFKAIPKWFHKKISSI